MDPSTVAPGAMVIELVVALVVALALVGGYRYVSRRRSALPPGREAVESRWSKESCMATYLEPVDAAVLPRSAVTECPRCHRVCWHEMVPPKTRDRSDWPGLGEDALEIRTWGGRSPVRYVGHREPVDEYAWEVVRVCSQCGVRWGSTRSGEIQH